MTADEHIEIWKDIPNHPGYQVSDLGRVRSFWKRFAKGKAPGGIGLGWGTKVGDTPHILKQSTNHYGYFVVNLGKNQVRHVANLVIEAFVGPRPEGQQCCHGPSGKRDNRVQNLCWGTRSKNLGEDRVRDGTDHRGDKCPTAKLTNKEAEDIYRRVWAGEKGYLLAKEFGVSSPTISEIKHKKKRSFHLNSSSSHAHGD
jgi:NUMOD4 motif/HNH endonuclease